MYKNKVVIEYLDGVTETLYGQLVIDSEEGVFSVVGEEQTWNIPQIVVRHVTENN